MQDLPGPKLRIGKLADDVAELEPGRAADLRLRRQRRRRGRRAAHVHLLGRPRRRGRPGRDHLPRRRRRCACASTATRPASGEIDTVVEIGGAVASRQGLNIPGEAASLPAVPEEDLEHLRGRRADRRRPRRAVVRAPRRGRRVRPRHTRLPLVAKIEKPQAVQRAEEIVRAADCVMVARGDLGIEMRIEEVPIVQKQVIALAGALARPSITATQMLDSMVSSSRPTRAEVADVANAILDGTDAVMLSQESAVGAVPGRGDRDDGRDRRAHRADRRPTASGTSGACGATAATPPTRSPTPRAAPRTSSASRRSSCPTLSGRSARLISAHRPTVPILRALARPRDRAPLRADVGRAGGLDEALRGHRGPDPRAAPRASSSSAGSSPATASGSRRACRRGSRGRRACSRSRRSDLAAAAARGRAAPSARAPPTATIASGERQVAERAAERRVGERPRGRRRPPSPPRTRGSRTRRQPGRVVDDRERHARA